MRIGVDYYPEHWDKSLWRQDADLMKETGVKVVRMAEFAWSRLEPQEGTYDFEWLDEAIEIFAEREIKVVLCTPSNCMPLWFFEKYPTAMQTERDAHKTTLGIRGHRCLNNANVLKYSDRIIDFMTKRYADNKAVIGWQIDNELESNFCFCGTCAGKFKEWVKKKYGSIEKVNEAYGNSVWSGEYSSWEQIKPPYGKYPYAWLNPSLVLDFNRYASDSMIEYVERQAAIIRKNCPDTQITTNVWFCENKPNFYKCFKNLDFISYDNYPTTKIPDDSEVHYSHAFHLDLMRGVKQKKFWIMEQLSGGLGSWAPMSRTTSPGMIEGYSLQAFAHGADTVLHFRWRTATSGAEMHWHGLIDHSNVPGRRFKEFASLCKTAAALQGVQNTEIKSDIAILYSTDTEYAFKIQPQAEGMYYLEQLMLMHEAFTKFGLNVDVISQDEDISEYKIVVAPELYVTDSSVADRLYAFTENGGTVILTNRSGVKDENNKCIMEQLPTVYRKLAGAYVEEYNPIGCEQGNIKFADGSVFKCRQWCDILATDTAEIVASYDSDFYKGRAAVTRNRYGNGTAYYVGTISEKRMYQKLIKDILTDTGLSFVENLPDYVEISTRSGNDMTVRFIFNNTNYEQKFAIGNENITLAPFEMKIDYSSLQTV